MNQTQKLSGLRCDTAGMGHISCVFSGSQGPQSHPSPSELSPATEDLGGRGPGRMGGCFPASKHNCVAQWHLISCDTGAPGGPSLVQAHHPEGDTNLHVPSGLDKSGSQPGWLWGVSVPGRLQSPGSVCWRRPKLSRCHIPSGQRLLAPPAAGQARGTTRQERRQEVGSVL